MGAPARHLEQGLLKDQRVNLGNPTEAFRNLQELVGRQDASFRVLPSRQRLDAADSEGLGVELRLEEGDKRVALQRSQQLVRRLLRLDRDCSKIIRKDLDAVTPFLLCLVEGDIGVHQQLLRRLPRHGLAGNASAATDTALLAFDLDGTRQHGDDLQSHFLRPVRRIGSAGDDHELVAADPRHDFLRSDNFPKARRCGLEHLVARAVPKRVVHMLEVVQIDVNEGELLGKIGRVCRNHELVEKPPVRQSGEGIVQGLVLENTARCPQFPVLLLRLRSCCPQLDLHGDVLGDIPVGTDDPHRPVRSFLHCAMGADVADLSGGQDCPEVLQVGETLVDRSLECGLGVDQVVGVEPCCPVLERSLVLVMGLTIEVAHVRIPQEIVCLGVVFPNPDLGGLKRQLQAARQYLQPLFAFPQQEMASMSLLHQKPRPHERRDDEERHERRQEAEPGHVRRLAAPPAFGNCREIPAIVAQIDRCRHRIFREQLRSTEEDITLVRRRAPRDSNIECLGRRVDVAVPVEPVEIDDCGYQTPEAIGTEREDRIPGDQSLSALDEINRARDHYQATGDSLNGRLPL